MPSAPVAATPATSGAGSVLGRWFSPILLANLVLQVLIITTGGVSAGAYEVVKDAFGAGAVDFVKVAMQPGMPQGAGRVTGAAGPATSSPGTPIVTLPGNPVSALVSFEVFVRPLLRRMLGLEPAVAPTTTATLAAALRSPAGKVQFARATLRRDPSGGGWVATAVAGQGSHFVTDLAAADALLVVPAEVTLLQPGDEVESILL